MLNSNYIYLLKFDQHVGMHGQIFASLVQSCTNWKQRLGHEFMTWSHKTLQNLGVHIHDNSQLQHTGQLLEKILNNLNVML